MEPKEKISVIKENGAILGPAERQTVRRWAEEGGIDPNDRIQLADGRRMLAMEDDELRVILETSRRGEVKHPGLRDVLIGSLLCILAVGLAVVTLVAPRAMNLLPGNTNYTLSLTYWWMLVCMAAIGGGALIFRGAREKKRARYLEAESF